MPASPRAGAVAAWHHVINRGGVRGGPFEVRAFLERLADLDERFGVEIHAYCVMGSHYHLLVRARSAHLAPAMRYAEGLASASPRCVPVRAERHALHVTRYIHLNPVAAGLVTRAQDWPWTSYRGYLNPPEGPPWLHVRTLLARFGAIGAHQRYRVFVEAGIDRGGKDVYGVERIEPLPGKAFHGSGPAIPLAAIAREVAAAFGIAPERLRVSRGRPRSGELIARGAFVYAARRLGRWSLPDIAAWLGYSSLQGPVRAAARFQAAVSLDAGLLRRLAAVGAAWET